MYLVLSALISSPISLVAATKATVVITVHGVSTRVTRVTNRLRRLLGLGQCVDGNLKSGLNVLFFPLNSTEGVFIFFGWGERGISGSRAVGREVYMSRQSYVRKI